MFFQPYVLKELPNLRRENVSVLLSVWESSEQYHKIIKWSSPFYCCPMKSQWSLKKILAVRKILIKCYKYRLLHLQTWINPKFKILFVKSFYLNHILLRVSGFHFSMRKRDVEKCRVVFKTLSNIFDRNFLRK